MSASLALGLVNALITHQEDLDYQRNDQPAPDWTEAFIINLESGVLTLTPEEGAPGEGVDTWPLVRWADAYTNHHEQATSGVPPELALRLFRALLQQAAPVQAWQASGVSLAQAPWEIQRLHGTLLDRLADRQYGHNRVWVEALTIWTGLDNTPLDPVLANDMLVCALQSGDVASVRSALAAGADPNLVDLDGAPALTLPSTEVTEDTLAMVGLLLDAGARPDQPDAHGLYPEDHWWTIEPWDRPSDTVPDPILRLREVAFPPEPLHAMEHLLAYWPQAEFNDRLERAGLNPQAPFQGKDWDTWQILSLWRRYSTGEYATELHRMASSTWPNEWQDKPTWQLADLQQKAVSLPADSTEPAMFWKQLWESQPLTPGSIDAWATLLENEPGLPRRNELALRLLHKLSQQPDIAIGIDPSGPARYTAWLQRLADPAWHADAPRQKPLAINRSLFGTSPGRVISLSVNEEILSRLSPTDQRAAGVAVLQLVPTAWGLDNALGISWDKTTKPATEALSPWFHHAVLQPGVDLNEVTALWPDALKLQLGETLSQAQHWGASQKRSASLVERPASLIPRLRRRS